MEQKAFQCVVNSMMTHKRNLMTKILQPTLVAAAMLFGTPVFAMMDKAMTGHVVTEKVANQTLIYKNTTVVFKS